MPVNPALAFMHYPEVAVAHAPTGRLAELDFAVKDLFDVAGYPTSAGSPIVLARSGIKTLHAPVVQRLLDAGANFVGKTITDEFAFSLNGRNAHFGAPRNGAAPQRITGGSSSGSASAVSNGLCHFAIGTDTGGSIRAPASHCGLFGMRPTHARISLDGCFDLAPSFDTCGFFAPDAKCFSRVADVLLGADLHAYLVRPRLLYATDAFALLGDTLRMALAPALGKVERVLGDASHVVVGQPSFDALHWALRYLQGREVWQVHGRLIEDCQPPLGPGVAERFAWAREITDPQVAASEVVRKQFRNFLAALLGTDGVLLLPTVHDVAPLCSESNETLENYRYAAVRLLCLASLAGLPQVTLPLATHLQAPLGLSLIGPAGSDRALVRLAKSITA